VNLRHELRLFFVALQFLTRVPVPAWVGYEPDWLNASARHFPLVGLCVGVSAAIVLTLASRFVLGDPAVWVAMALALLLTGAFHEDGLADTFDALGGSASRERALEIMKDSRLGTYGVAALVVVLALKASLLASMPVASACAAWVLAHTASRAVPVVLIRLLPYAGDVSESKAKPMAQGVSRSSVHVALLWVAFVAVALVLWRGAWLWGIVWALVAAVLVGWGCQRWFARRLGGITGDTLGAAQQLTELAMLLAWVAAHRGLHL
jgi:adenosylcobinamide-GDP ribazoletransferase